MIRLQLVSGVEYDEVMYAPGGIVNRWVREVSSELFFHMKREAPVNKRPNKTHGEPPVGSLNNSVYSDVSQIGPKELTIEAGASVHYATYVVKGTSTIYAKSGRIPAGEPGAGQFVPIGSDGEWGAGMYLPANPGYGGPAWRQRVRGQAANNFIGRAYDMTARVHPALRGISME